MSAISTGVRAGLNEWQTGPVPPEFDVLQQRYLEKWSLYDGTLFEQMARDNPYRNDPSIYQNTKLLWKHAEAVVDFYAGVIYQGTLSTDGKPLPDGTLGAIPIDPQVDSPGQEKNLRTAIAELWAAWNWHQQMSLRPMYAAALGDCLTELVDDTDRGFVYPQIVWPGYVKEIELDYVGNIRSYTLEYRVDEKQRDGSIRRYTFRKDVDKESFRYYRDDTPYDEYGEGPVVPNQYGFVPAIWDRHRIAAPGHVRGKSALDGTRQALLQLNSIFAHAFDYQRKAFFLPPMLASTGGRQKPPSDINLGVPTQTAADSAQSFQYVSVPDGAQLLQPTIDVGKTREMLQDLRENILAENPEASFYQQLRAMQLVTAPGAERLQGDVKNRVDLVRSGEDAQTVKLFQMAVSMCGARANGEWWKRDANGRRKALTRRQMVFLPFDLLSYSRGEMDFSILPRPLVVPSEEERINRILQREQIQTRSGLIDAGYSDDAKGGEESEVDRQLRERREAAAMETGTFASVDDREVA